jgi:zinc transport system substrate-binding protein
MVSVQRAINKGALPMFSKFSFKIFFILSVSIMAIFFTGCSKQQDSVQPVAQKRLSVVTTLFPVYDFAKQIVGSSGAVTLLLPPGVEPHSFEPKPEDIVRISKAAVLVYTSRHMEPWAEKTLKSVDVQKLKIVEAGAGVTYRKSTSGHEGHGHGHGKKENAALLDPHIWLDFTNAILMVDNILAGIASADPANAKLYNENAAVLKEKLTALDRRYKEGLSACETRKLLHGGHFAFGYLAGRYNLEYSSLSGVSSESEPSAAKMAGMVRQIKRFGLKYIFTEELLSPRLTEALAAEAGVGVLKLHGAHNVSRDDFQRGISFFDLMDENLANLQKGMACRSK